MKNSRYILLVVAVVVVLLLGLAKNKTSPAVVSPSVREICYIYNTEAGDSASLRIVSTDGQSVTGSLKILPKEKDSKVGNFAGSVESEDGVGYLTAIWDVSAEGVTNKEELSIIFEQAVARVGFGEMKDNGKGLYEYADPANISYTFNLQEASCDDSALK